MDIESSGVPEGGNNANLTRRTFLVGSIAAGLELLRQNFTAYPQEKDKDKEKDEKKEKPALTDDGSKEAKGFVKAWEAKPANFKVDKEHIRSRVHVKKSFTNDEGAVDVDIYNRAGFVSKEEFKDGVQIDFQLMSEDQLEDKDKLKPAPTYGDHPTVVLRTSGEFGKEKYWEIADGYVVRFSMADQDVRINKVKQLGNGKTTQEILKIEPLKLQEGNFETVRITDDGFVIKVYVGTLDKPVLEFDTSTVGDDGSTPKRFVALYNTEPKSAGEKSGIVGHKMTAATLKVTALKKQ